MPTPTIPDPAPTPEVIPATDLGGYFVASLSRPGAYWFVTVDHGHLRCRCERGTAITAQVGDVGAARFCRHGKILLRWISATGKATARPSAPVNISALVD